MKREVKLSEQIRLVDKGNEENILREWAVDRKKQPLSEEHDLMESARTPSSQLNNDKDKNNRPLMVKEISHIHFTILSTLRLEGNDIQSIEGLPNVDMPQIKKLVLCNNKITSVKVIRKAAWPTFKALYLGENYFRDAYCLTKSDFPQMKELSVYTQWREKSKFIDHGFAFKLQAPLSFLSIGKKDFCFNRSTQRVLREKWRYVRS